MGTPIPTAGQDKGLGGQPIVQPNGPWSCRSRASTARSPPSLGRRRRVVEPRRQGRRRSASTASRGACGPARCRAPRSPATARSTSPGRTAASARRCASNDIVFSTSTDGVTWTDPARVPIDPATSAVDHFIPGLAVDAATSRGRHPPRADVLLLPERQLRRRPASSRSATSPRPTAVRTGAPRPSWPGRWRLGEIAADVAGTDGRRLHLDVLLRRPAPRRVFAVGRTRLRERTFDEAMYAPTTPLGVATPAEATNPASSAGVVGPITGVGIGETHHDLKQD